MVWKVEFSKLAASQFSKLDKPEKVRVKNFIAKIAAMENPRYNGKALQGQYAEYYRYRLGNYRLICHIQDGLMLITVIKLGHRGKIY